MRLPKAVTGGWNRRLGLAVGGPSRAGRGWKEGEYRFPPQAYDRGGAGSEQGAPVAPRHYVLVHVSRNLPAPASGADALVPSTATPSPFTRSPALRTAHAPRHLVKEVRGLRVGRHDPHEKGVVPLRQRVERRGRDHRDAVHLLDDRGEQRCLVGAERPQTAQGVDAGVGEVRAWGRGRWGLCQTRAAPSPQCTCFLGGGGRGGQAHRTPPKSPTHLTGIWEWGGGKLGNISTSG